MNMMEIDPHLFIKCRLCLEETGNYQIVPAIRDQIFFCFRINVEPFDGLPQLICKKCQLVLYEYSKTKLKFIQKQEDFKKRKPETNFTTTALNRSKTHRVSKRQHVNNSKDEAYTENKKKRHDSKSNQLNTSAAAEEIRNTANEDENTAWKDKYQKAFTCTLCNFTCSTLKSMNSHQVIHKALKIKHVNIFKKYCIVRMDKIDSNPNLTRTTDHVVYSKNKIIAKSTAVYYIAYKYKDCLGDENLKCQEHDNADEYSDSSFQSIIKVRRRQARQLSSRSSIEAAVLENNANGLKTNDCISIDDSYDEDETNEQSEASENMDHIDTAIATNMISKLVTVSYKRYAKRHEALDKPILQQPNRKIISIGRQIINKQGFNTNLLMKYMEHLNLNIMWLRRSPLSVTNKSYHIKINPRTKLSNEKSMNDFKGYKKRYEHNQNIQNREPEATLDQELAVEESEAESTEQGRLDVVDHVPTAGMDQMSKVFQDVNVSPIEQSDGHVDDPILLNENPVANTKQLNEVQKSKLVSYNSMPTLEVHPGELSSEVMTNDENNMPVITFARSLANPNENSTNKNAKSCIAISSNEISKPEPLKTGPRIKVKSISDLMSKETLSRMYDAAPVLSPNQQLNGAAQYALTLPETTLVSSTETKNEECVILDSLEFPNTKTNSPFNYFRMLLQVHNLCLLGTDAIPTPDFQSLIRFKVRYNNGIKSPVELSLSLLCYKTVFYINIRDCNHENHIEISKMSPIWQWEILKIFQGDVVSKVLINAEKTSPEVYTNTKHFVCILKSIHYVPTLYVH